MKKTAVYEKTVTIPTYRAGAPEKNPLFIEKRAYQGSTGKVYPVPICESISEVKEDADYRAVILENDYLYVMILPELGGRIQRALDKTNNYDFIYYNRVIMPELEVYQDDIQQRSDDYCRRLIRLGCRGLELLREKA